MENIIRPKKSTQPDPDRQPPLIDVGNIQAPEPPDDETLRRIAHENQEELRKQREEADGNPYTDI